MKIRPVEAEFHVDGWTDTHDEANSRFFKKRGFVGTM